jgi:hypothetical protein
VLPSELPLNRKSPRLVGSLKASHVAPTSLVLFQTIQKKSEFMISKYLLCPFAAGLLFAECGGCAQRPPRPPANPHPFLSTKPECTKVKSKRNGHVGPGKFNYAG